MQVMGRLVNNSFVPVIIVIEFKSALPQDCFYSYRGPLTVWNLYFWSKQIESEVKETLISSREFAKEKWICWRKQNQTNSRRSNHIHLMVRFNIFMCCTKCRTVARSHGVAWCVALYERTARKIFQTMTKCASNFLISFNQMFRRGKDLVVSFRSYRGEFGEPNWN